MDQLDADLHQKILSNLNPRDVARAGGANKALRTASRTEFHSIVNNPHVIHVAERYKSKLRSPKVEMLDEPTLKETRQDLPEKNRFGQGTQFRSVQPVDVGGGQVQMLGHGDRTFAGRGLKYYVDHHLTDQIGRPIDRGR
jgi:hypothetical protein